MTATLFERKGDVIHVGERGLGAMMAGLAAELGRALGDPSTTAYQRICGPINTSADVDDPLVGLERQMGIEGRLGLVSASATKRDLTEEEAEAWLDVLGLGLAANAAHLGVLDESDLERIGEDAAGRLQIFGALQVLLIRALDGEDPELPDDLPESLFG